MSRQWRLFLLALGYFTRLPLPPIEHFEPAELNDAARYFPLVGVLVGLAGALVFCLSLQLLPLSVSIVLSMLATVWLTGVFHEDGLADTMDGLGGGWTREQALAIMKDSRIGSYGAIALLLALMLKFTSLSHIKIEILPFVMVAAHAVSRLAAVLVIARQEYVREEGKAKPLASKLSLTSLWVAIVLGLAPMLLLPVDQWPALLLVAVVWLWFSRKLSRRLGGYTGDCLGAMQQLTELAFYLGILMLAF
ncbi:adenosylcobinamide-GDP ribazoletransferase [Methylobacillus arboreus]|uniref:adenosylcobinamide-GDP ribazoletransferase n=1 Tax=Methylobacillus arboreus TaxID=755170 RepID=UPI001E549EE8|nr:adenosylcobinamide-GDP ribazoletransferase [Methylobacillus arboreus]MCB5190099.1 adenosylcobinamide-GDP ribazoletransferase [Methylobacillus arboreus]